MSASSSTSVLEALGEYMRRRAWLSIWHWIGEQEQRKRGLHWTQNLHRLKKVSEPWRGE